MEHEAIDYFNLTHPQKRIWYIDKINFNVPLHNIGGCLKINETINVEIMKETLNIIIENNEGLRLRFFEKDGQPLQYVSNFIKENIDFIDFSNYENSREKQIKWAENIYKRNFKLEDSRLYYFAIYKLSENEYGVLLNIHHIIADGWSISLIEKQICEIYEKLIRNEKINSDEYYSYLGFVKEEKEYINSERFMKNKRFWKEKFNNIPEEFLYKSTNNLEGCRKSFNISSGLSNKVKGLLATERCSLNTFFIALVFIYMNKVKNKEDLVIGMPVFNRTDRKQKNIIGMFTSTVPFRFKLDTELNIKSLLKLINQELRLILVNQKYPYDLLINELGLSKLGYDSLFEISVNYYNFKFKNNVGNSNASIEEYYNGNQSYSLQLTVKEMEDDNITLNFDYKKAEYLDIEIKGMYDTIINITEQILLDEDTKVRDLKLLNKEDINNKIYKLNETTSYYPKKTVCELFEEQAIKNPNRIALEFKERSLTYKELNEKSNQLAYHLRKIGIARESIVGIIETHSIELLISILGVLKAGGAYLPIDPSYPIERINYMLQNSESKVVLTNFQIDKGINFQGKIININDIDINLYSKQNLEKINDLNDLVYIIYTSGSTGRPKGVMVEHQNLVNYIWWAKKMYLKGNGEIMALYSSISFDLTVTSIFTPLISGNKIIVYDTDDTEFVLYKILRDNKATIIKLTPSHLILLKDIDNNNSSVKRFIVGGEDLKADLAKEIYSKFQKNIEIYNEYGPTETVVGCMIYKYDEEKDIKTSVPIGYPADNVQIYILDNNLNVVPTGLIGELYVSGDGVARGYLKQNELTSERFIENPFIKGKRMYRTGDLVRCLENGIIEYVGRIDNQVKIRGQRIELAEIERRLLENESIKNAVVINKENKSLIAYVVTKKEATDIELKNWLIKFLPVYMIPSIFVFMNQLPISANGKINYGLLPDPVVAKKEIVMYKNNLEKELIITMEEILGVKDISLNDNFYQIGGDSIKAIQIASILNDIGLSIKVKDILNNDCIEEIASTIVENQDRKNINQDYSQGDIDNTPITEWFFNEKFANENKYSQYVILEYEKNLDINKVSTAVNKLIQYHDSLRINYNRKNRKLYYNNKHLNNQYSARYFNLSQSYDYYQGENIKKLIKEAEVRFDIENSLLFSVSMFELGENRQALLFIAHHLIVDGVSWRIIINDFIAILKQLDNNKDITLPLKTHSYKEWAEELQYYRKKISKEEKLYWNSILEKNYANLEKSSQGKRIGKLTSILSCEIDENITSDLIKKVNEIYSIELYETLIIALAITINKITNCKDVVIEIERHGRENINDYIDISRTVGWFTSMYPLYLKIDNEDIENKIKILKEQLRSIPNQGFNYSILKYLNHDLKEVDKKYIRFNYLGNLDNIINDSGFNITNIDFGLDSDDNNILTSLLDVEAIMVNKKLKISVIYSNNEFENEVIQRFIDSYSETLKLILNHCYNKSFKEYTPSDFDTVDISQEDLDNLFN